jgi:hypothetical protein
MFVEFRQTDIDIRLPKIKFLEKSGRFLALHVILLQNNAFGFSIAVVVVSATRNSVSERVIVEFRQTDIDNGLPKIKF